VGANGAYATFEERQKGSLEPGKWADLAVLSDDYLSVPEDRIPAIQVLMTMVGGQIVHERA
jgi:predicted amidohydrolase YtcJ